MNILITSAGRRVSLVKSFQKEAVKLNMKSKVFASDANPHYSAACQVADHFFGTPRIDHPDYLDKLLTLCRAHEVGLIIPTIDTELLFLAENYHMFTNEGIDVLISDKSLVARCRDKRLTHELFLSKNIEVARIYNKKNPVFPIFIKPFDGSASIDVYRIDSPDMLTEYHLNNDRLLFFEYLDPKEHAEFTVDIYYDRNSTLRCVVPRERIEVRGGEVNKGITRKNFLVPYLNERLSTLEGARGCITLQVFVNRSNKRVVGIEINPRFGGGYPLTYLSGANYSKWVLEEYFLNKNLSDFNEWEDNLLMLRYDDELLIHDFKY